LNPDDDSIINPRLADKSKINVPSSAAATIVAMVVEAISVVEAAFFSFRLVAEELAMTTEPKMVCPVLICFILVEAKVVLLAEEYP